MLLAKSQIWHEPWRLPIKSMNKLLFTQRIIASTQPRCFRNVFAEKKKSYKFLCNSLIFRVAGVGPEPTTSGLWIRRSNQLSYPAITTSNIAVCGCKGNTKFLITKIYFEIISHWLKKSNCNKKQVQRMLTWHTIYNHF